VQADTFRSDARERATGPLPTTTSMPRGRHVATALDVFTFEGVLIKEITAFITPDVFARFGLARVLDA
jgi:hypothetical protein